MKAITNMTTGKKCLSTPNDLQKANELNDFFLRFEAHDFSSKCDNVLKSICVIDQDAIKLIEPTKVPFQTR